MIRLILLFLLLWGATPSYAVRVNSLYMAKVQIASQTADARVKVLPQALAQVFVKISGNKTVLQNPDIKAHLPDAQSLMQEFSYSASKDAAQPYYLEVQFDPEAVNKILREAALPLWGANRSLILAWITTEGPNHKSEVVDALSANPIQTVLKINADRRGLPLILPSMDVTDLNVISANDIVKMDLPKLQQAAQRYASEAILIVHVIQNANGFIAQAKLVLSPNEWQWNIAGNSVPAVIKTLTDVIADTLAERYATVVTQNVQSKILIKITHVSQQDDLINVLHYVERLPSVATAEVEQILGDDILLNVNLRGSLESFNKTLSVGKKMTPIPTESNSKLLAYQWNR